MRSVAIALGAFAASVVAVPVADLDARTKTVYDVVDVYTTVWQTDVVQATNIAIAESSSTYKKWWWHGGHGGHGGQGQSSQAPAPAAPTTTEAPAPAATTPDAETQVASTPDATSEAPAPTSSAPAASASAGSSTTPSGSYAQRVVDHHNFHRSNHSAGDVQWDDQLASIAQQIGQSCNYAHDTTTGGISYGQNIAAGAPADNITSVITDLFYNNEMMNFAQLYGQATPSNINDEQAFDGWGHFTQIVWKGTTKVGCATVDCTGKGNGPQGLGNVGANVPPFFTVCNYSPPGNYLGEFDKNVAQPAGQPSIDWSYKY